MIGSESVRRKIGALIRKHRLKCGLTQRFLASQFRVSVQTVRNWEAGRWAPAGYRMNFLELYLEMDHVAAVELQSLMCGRMMVDHLTFHPAGDAPPVNWYPSAPPPTPTPPLPQLPRPSAGFELPPLNAVDVAAFKQGNEAQS